MKPHTTHLLIGLCLVWLSNPLSGGAATLWNGPLITYTQPAPDPTQATNRDQLTAHVSLTRALTSGMFNGVSETAYTHDLSPADTLWAVGDLANYATLTYTSWEAAGGGNPVLNLPGQQLVVHLVTDDIYLSLKFTALGGHSAGGFSYLRSTPAPGNVAPTVAIDSPTNGATFAAPARVSITATAQDSDGSVTNVAFYDWGTFLGGTNNPPYAVTASLATGGHALAAVATDNLGLSTTSAVVNVTVSFAPGFTYVERRMVSDIPGLAEHTDPNLVNPWGIAFSPTGPFWVTDTGTGVATVYNSNGELQPLVVTIPPPAGGTPPSSPIGMVYNNTPDFLLGPGLPSPFIFSMEGGTIAGWNSGAAAVTKVDNSASVATYKGLALGSSGGSNYLYAPNFHSGQVDVFDANYQQVTLAGSFSDPTLPAGFAPFSIQNIGGQLYIAYALQDANGHDDVSGPGNGFVNVFATSGHLLKRFASNGVLNSPWGIVLTPAGFGGFSQALLIGNFGDGRINAFDPATGQFLGVVQSASGAPIVIHGLWDLKFGNGGQAGEPHTLYFTAGIPGGGNIEDHGLFGSISEINVWPSVTITNPAENASFGNTDTITIGAAASDTDGSVTNVQFFDGLVSLGNDASSPYSISTRLSLGAHTVTAVASDNLGLTTTSAPVHLTVARYLPAITNGSIAILLQPVATGMAAPDYAISPPGDTNRLFVVEQNGLLRIIQNGTLLPGSALDIQSRVQPPLVATSPNDERGFLGLAFHPGFNNPASPGYQTLYTYNSEMIPAATTPTYPVPTTATNNYKNVVNEWKISTGDTNVVDPASRREVISFGKNAGNHNGGTITFGPDGYLYLALGDGGNANDVGPSHIEPGGNAQNLSTPLGKFLRFDPLNPALTASSADPISANGQYRIPTTNPFQGPGQVPEIYALGLRNPYRFCFDRVTGDLIHADVGQNNVEEIDRIILGGNYGWAIKEGDFLFNRTNGPSGNAGTIGAPPGNRSPGIPAGLIDPISGPMGTLEYDHNEGISITGGFVYRGKAMPELYGKYVFGDLALKTAPVRADGRLFYADLQAGTINAFTLPQFGGTAILPNGLTVHGFGEDADGELYALVTNTSANGTGGIVYKIFPAVPLSLQMTSNALEISWPAAGGRLQAQTNSPGAGLGTNWATVPGSTLTNRVVVPINPTNGSVFYRLAIP